MKFLRLYFQIMLVVSAFTNVFAYNSDHGPFFDEEVIERIPVVMMDRTLLIESDEKPWEYRFEVPGESNIWIYAWGDEEEGFSVEVFREGQCVVERTDISGAPFLLGLWPYTGDVNRDGIPDFMIYVYSGGVGLAVGCCQVTVVLSDGEGYHLVSVGTLFPDESDYIMMDGRSCFIQTDYFGWEEGFDWQTQNYWVYNLLVIDGSEIRIDNSLHPDFPKTIWYSPNPNHAEADLPTEKQKDEMMERAQERIFEMKGGINE